MRKPPEDPNQIALFSAMFTDVALKDEREVMEVPFLSLSKRPRLKPIEYSVNGTEVKVTGGDYGIANIWDYDLIIWLMSQVQCAKNIWRPTSRKIRFHRSSYLLAVRRAKGGTQYKNLEDSIIRLRTTSIKTNIREKEKGKGRLFSWLDGEPNWETDSKGKITWCTVSLSEWLYEAVSNDKYILTLNKDYFLLTGGLERWLYRLIRKSVGTQVEGWKWKLSTLHKLSGSSNKLKYFNDDLRKYIKKNSTLLDYNIQINNYDDKRESYLFAAYEDTNKKSEFEPTTIEEQSIDFVQFQTTTYEIAKKFKQTHECIYELQSFYVEEHKDSTTAEGFISWVKSRRKPQKARLTQEVQELLDTV